MRNMGTHDRHHRGNHKKGTNHLKKLMNESISDNYFNDKRHSRQQLKNKYIARFRREFPQFSKLSGQQILLIFKMYKNNC